MKGQTDAMKAAKQLKQFYSRLMPVIKTYNITIFTINHINQKIEINPFAKSQNQIMYLKQDESLKNPGGDFLKTLWIAGNSLELKVPKCKNL